MSQRVALITGGTRGLGLAIARALGQSGCHLVLTYLPVSYTHLDVYKRQSHGGNIAFMRLIRERLGVAPGEPDPQLALSCSPTVLGQVASRVGVRGPTVTVSTACASGTNSIGRAAELIELGRADLMLAGGADLFLSLIHI